jgi:hypothetical protein
MLVVSGTMISVSPLSSRKVCFRESIHFETREVLFEGGRGEEKQK